MRGSGTSKNAVWRWQERFMTEGVAGLLRDKTRQAIPRRKQTGPAPIPMDQKSQRDFSRSEKRAPSVRFYPLGLP
jgi:hypothetical protein